MRTTSMLLKSRLFQVERLTITNPEGVAITRDVVRHPGSVAIIPVVDADHICLIRNYRCAVDRTLWELPAGTRDRDETVQATAARELQEETGYVAGRWSHLRDFYLAPGILDERMSLFLAEDLTPGQKALEAGEEIQSAILSWPEIRGLIDRREIEDAKTLVGLLLIGQLQGRT